MNVSTLAMMKQYGQARLDGWWNRLIQGDNAAVLKSLRSDSTIAGLVTLIYIDPPFATNNVFRAGDERTATISRSEDDAKAYTDHLIGEEYIRFLRERLVLMRELMSDEGTIYVHTDTKVGHRVRSVLDDVFGDEHFISEIARIKCNPKNFPRKAYGNIRDTILVYSKTDEYVWNDPRRSLSGEDIKRLFPKVDEDGRRYTTTPLHAPGETKNGPTGQEWRGMKPPRGRHWRVPPEKLEELDEQGQIEWSSTGNPRRKKFADDVLVRGMSVQDVWTFKDPQYPSYPTEKNLDMLRLIVRTSSNPDDLVLDAFCGSGTSLVAAGLEGRRWIGIDNSPLAAERATEKLISVMSGTGFVIEQRHGEENQL
jgi:adenine-specific DNA-methyltransferase